MCALQAHANTPSIQPAGCEPPATPVSLAALQAHSCLALLLGPQAFVVLGNSLQGAAAAFVLTTGLPLDLPDPPGGANPSSTATAASGGTGAAAAASSGSAAAASAADATQAQQQQQQQQPGPGPSAGWDVSQLRLWNPLTGHCVPVRDPACELREVRGAPATWLCVCVCVFVGHWLLAVGC